MPGMMEFHTMTADQLVQAGFDALEEAQAAHYVATLGNGAMRIRDPRDVPEGAEAPMVNIHGGQARVHADFMLGQAAALFTAALATGSEFEFDDDADDYDEEPETMADTEAAKVEVADPNVPPAAH